MDRFVALAAGVMQVELDESLACVHGSREDESFCEHEGILGCAFRDSDIEHDGEYGIIVHSIDEVAGAEILVKECSLDCDSIVLTLPMRILPPLERVFLRAGRYSVRLTRPAEAPGPVILGVTGDDCS